MSNDELYGKREDWSDVVPIPQHDPSANPVAPIFYTESCMLLRTSDSEQSSEVQVQDKDATDYFRGIVKKGEMSERVLDLTETIIRMNPAHYSAWYATMLTGRHNCSSSGQAVPLQDASGNQSAVRQGTTSHG